MALKYVALKHMKDAEPLYKEMQIKATELLFLIYQIGENLKG